MRPNSWASIAKHSKLQAARREETSLRSVNEAICASPFAGNCSRFWDQRCGNIDTLIDDLPVPLRMLYRLNAFFSMKKPSFPAPYCAGVSRPEDVSELAFCRDRIVVYSVRASACYSPSNFDQFRPGYLKWN
jgi:hypothetical protein